MLYVCLNLTGVYVNVSQIILAIHQLHVIKVCFTTFCLKTNFAWLSKKGENDSENFSGPKSRKFQNHSQSLFLSDLDLKNLGLGLHRAAEEAFLAEKADFYRENMVFTVLTKRKLARGCPSNFFVFANRNYPRLSLIHI